MILLWLKTKNLFRKVIKKPLVVERDGRKYVNLQTAMKNANRHQRRAMKVWAKRNPDKIIYT
jgi:hypothetical protein